MGILVNVFYHKRGRLSMTADEIAAAVKAGHADVVDLWEAVQQFAAQRSSKWLKLGRGGVTFDDLQQEAFIAMLQALEGWDPDAGAFLTWYGIWIKKAFTVACSLRSARGSVPRSKWL
ncbi:MAG: sigma factor [Dysosmobacter sp.]